MMGHGRTAFVSVSENLSSQIIQLIWSFRVKSTQIFDFAIIFFLNVWQSLVCSMQLF